MIDIRLMGAGELTSNDWRDLQGVARAAYRHAIDRPQDDIDALVHWDDPEAFAESRRDPNILVGEEFFENQEYRRPHVAVALEGGMPVGYICAADNVSGNSDIVRTAKRLSVVWNYLSLREVVVHPDQPHAGVARRLGLQVLCAARDRQPVSAYVLPDETPGIDKVLRKFGFLKTGYVKVQPYGKTGVEVRQLRMEAKSAKEVRCRLAG